MTKSKKMKNRELFVFNVSLINMRLNTPLSEPVIEDSDTAECGPTASVQTGPAPCTLRLSTGAPLKVLCQGHSLLCEPLSVCNPLLSPGLSSGETHTQGRLSTPSDRKKRMEADNERSHIPNESSSHMSTRAFKQMHKHTCALNTHMHVCTHTLACSLARTHASTHTRQTGTQAAPHTPAQHACPTLGTRLRHA